MKKILLSAALVALFTTVGCKQTTSDLSGKKKSDSKNKDYIPQVAQKVQALKTQNGYLSCSGADKNLNLIRTRADINKGQIESLVVSAYGGKDNPAAIMNELNPAELAKYELFKHDVKKKMLDLELDLDGKKFEIEVTAEMSGKARKVYELDIDTDEDGEGSHVLNAYLTYKDISTNLDLSEVLMGCSVHHKD